MKRLIALALVCLSLGAQLLACGCNGGAAARPQVTRPVTPR